MEHKEEKLNSDSPVIVAARACLEAYKKIYWFHSTEMKLMQVIFCAWDNQDLRSKSFEYLILNALVDGVDANKKLMTMLSGRRGKTELSHAYRAVRQKFLKKYEAGNQEEYFFSPRPINQFTKHTRSNLKSLFKAVEKQVKEEYEEKSFIRLMQSIQRQQNDRAKCIVEENTSLLLRRGNFQGFEGITAFQYARWLMYPEACELLAEHMDEKDQLIQIQEVNHVDAKGVPQLAWVRKYGKEDQAFSVKVSQVAASKSLSSQDKQRHLWFLVNTLPMSMVYQLVPKKITANYRDDLYYFLTEELNLPYYHGTGFLLAGTIKTLFAVLCGKGAFWGLGAFVASILGGWTIPVVAGAIVGVTHVWNRLENPYKFIEKLCYSLINLANISYERRRVLINTHARQLYDWRSYQYVHRSLSQGINRGLRHAVDRCLSAYDRFWFHSSKEMEDLKQWLSVDGYFKDEHPEDKYYSYMVLHILCYGGSNRVRSIPDYDYQAIRQELINKFQRNSRKSPWFGPRSLEFFLEDTYKILYPLFTFLSEEILSEEILAGSQPAHLHMSFPKDVSWYLYQFLDGGDQNRLMSTCSLLRNSTYFASKRMQKHIERNNHREVAHLLDVNPYVVFNPISFEDSLSRHFRNMTVFQYAYWLGNKGMCSRLSRVMPIEDQIKQIESIDQTVMGEPSAYFKDFLDVIRMQLMHLGRGAPYNVHNQLEDLLIRMIDSLPVRFVNEILGYDDDYLVESRRHDLKRIINQYLGILGRAEQRNYLVLELLTETAYPMFIVFILLFITGGQPLIAPVMLAWLGCVAAYYGRHRSWSSILTFSLYDPVAHLHKPLGELIDDLQKQVDDVKHEHLSHLKEQLIEQMKQQCIRMQTVSTFLDGLASNEASLDESASNGASSLDQDPAALSAEKVSDEVQEPLLTMPENHLDVDTPAVGDCLYWAVMMGVLIKYKDHNDFETMVSRLFGSENVEATTALLRDILMPSYRGGVGDINSSSVSSQWHALMMNFRSRIADRILESKDIYESIDGDIKAYVNKVRQQGTFGGHREIKAMSTILKVDVIVHQANHLPNRIYDDEYGHRSHVVHIAFVPAKKCSLINNHYRFFVNQRHVYWENGVESTLALNDHDEKQSASSLRFFPPQKSHVNRDGDDIELAEIRLSVN